MTKDQWLIQSLNTARDWPRHPDLAHNLYLVRNSRIDEQAPFLTDRILEQISLLELGILSLSLLCISLAIAVFRPHTHPIIKKSLALLSTVLVFGTTLLSISLYQHPKIVITAEKVAVQKAPLATSPVLFTLHNAAEAKEIMQHNHWVKIRSANQFEGWIPKKHSHTISAFR